MSKFQEYLEAAKSKKQIVDIYQLDNGNWKIKTKGDKDPWIDEFDSEEEATTYALRNGATVEGI